MGFGFVSEVLEVQIWKRKVRMYVYVGGWELGRVDHGRSESNHDFGGPRQGLVDRYIVIIGSIEQFAGCLRGLNNLQFSCRFESNRQSNGLGSSHEV